ncbi:MAG: hypothetical protein AB8B69_26510 [Chitinophagales bacterium]
MALTKLTIESYDNENLSGSAKNKFKALINPASYTHSHSVQNTSTGNCNKKEGATMPDNDSYTKTSPEVVKFTLIFDGTGAIPDTTKKTVFESIDKLKDTCYYYNGKIHRPNYLKLKWADNFNRVKTGSKYFTCQLTSMELSYKMFAPDGTPLRAEASLSFTEFRNSKTIVKAAAPSSPDLTHVRLVRQGDRLAMMCYEIYNDSSLYLQVAKANNLTNFRNIQPGQQLFFPPLKS